MFFLFIKISGKNSSKFIQSQFTCNINNIDKKYLFTCYCNYKGKVIASFFIKKENENFLIKINTNIIRKFLKIIKNYSILYHININVLNNSYFSQIDTIKNIKDRKIQILEFFSEKYHLFNLGINKIENSVSFSKGCYLGQEIISRIYFLSNKTKKESIVKYSDNYLFINKLNKNIIKLNIFRNYILYI